MCMPIHVQTVKDSSSVLSYELVVPGVDARTGLFTAVSEGLVVHSPGCIAGVRPGCAPGNGTDGCVPPAVGECPTVPQQVVTCPCCVQYRLIANGTFSSDKDAWQPGQVRGAGCQGATNRGAAAECIACSPTAALQTRLPALPAFIVWCWPLHTTLLWSLPLNKGVCQRTATKEHQAPFLSLPPPAVHAGVPGREAHCGHGVCRP